MLAPQAAGQCPPASNLSFALSIPPYTVSEGNTAGDVYTVTVTNNGTISATEASLLVDPNVGFYYLGGSATVASSFDSPTVSDPGTTAPNAPFTLALAGTAPANALEPGETLTFTFRLATTDYAPSAQLLVVSLQSGTPSPLTCTTTQQNVPTARGNLTIQKTSVVQDGYVGDTVTWTITLKNTGLGNVYDAVFTDTFGSGLSNGQVTPAPSPIDLAAGESATYTATAVVAACGNLTNLAQASWSIGNEDGTATGSNPASSEADIALLLQEPDIVVEVGSLPQVSYCGSLNTTVPVTITNNGGTGQQLVLDINTAGGLVVSNPQPGGDWNLVGNQLQYTGGTVPGMIRGGETITLTVDVSSSGSVCSGGTGSVQLTPRAYDACLLLQSTGTAGQSSTTLGPDAPTLSLNKVSSTGDIAYSGETFVYTITLAGTNITNTNGITVTDVLTDFLENVTPVASTGSVTQSGNVITWTLPATVATLNETLLITATIPDQSGTGTCNAGLNLPNTVNAVADVCPECSLSAQASTSFIVLDSLNLAQNSFEMTSSPLALCSTNTAAQQFTTTLQIGTGITWTGAIYTDTLGAGVFDAPYQVVAGSVQVVIDGVDRTSLVTTTLGPPLVIDFSNMSAFGAFSNTANITITYQALAGPTTLASDPSRTGFVEAFFEMPGPAQSCDGGHTAVLGTYVTLQRGNLGIDLAPATLNSCQVNTVTISVNGGNPDPDLLTDHLVVTFTAQAGDIYTPTAAAYSGALAGIPVTVTQSGVTTTFAFSGTAPITGDGSISFPLFRNCGETGPLTASLSYQDICPLPREAGPATAGNSTRSSIVSLLVTPDEYTVYGRQASWRWFVSNLGDLDATNAIVTNTLPVGYHFITYTLSTGYTPPNFLSTISAVTGTVGGQEVVTFTIGTLPIGARVQFDAQASINSCLDPAQVDVGLAQTCGQVQTGGGPTCSGVAVDHIIFHKGPSALLSSNNQDAAIPLCGEGLIHLVVKNASALSDEFEFVITDTITNATYVSGSAFVTVTNSSGNVVTGTTSGQLLANRPFTPTVATVGGTQVLTWDVASFASGTPAYDVLAERAGEDVITIDFRVATSCASSAAEVQSSATTRDICDVPLSTLEDSISLIVDEPALQVSKQGRNASAGNTLGNVVYAGVGDTVVWEVEVTNVGDARATNLFVTDTVPANFTPTTANTVKGYAGNIAGSTVDWGDAGGSGGLPIDPAETLTFVITGTVNNAVCNAGTTNSALAAYACSVSDVCFQTPVAAEATLNTKPSFTLDARNRSLDQCGGGPIRIDFDNNGARAQNVVITYTLPSGLAYNGLNGATAPTPDLTPALGATGTITFVYNTIPGLVTTPTLRFNVINDPLAPGTCANPGANPGNTAQLTYEDTCGNVYTDTPDDTNTITVLRSQLSIDQTPHTQVIVFGQTYTWTVSVQNFGNSPTNNLVITETLGNGWQNITAGNGSPGGAVPVIDEQPGGSMITWTVGSLANGQTWTATFSAQAETAQTDYRTTLYAHSECSTGGCAEDDVFVSYSTPLQNFVKNISQTPVSIGEPFSYTFTANFHGTRTYTNTFITDTLPTLASTLVFSYTDIAITNTAAATNTWTVNTSNPLQLVFTTSAPAANRVDGPDTLTVTVTGIISNELAANNNDIFTNTVDMTYIEDGQPYNFNTAVSGVVREPILQISKNATPTTGIRKGDEITYTLTLTHAPGSTATAYDVVVIDTIPDRFTYKPGSLLTSPAADATFTANQVISATYNVFAPTDPTHVITYVVTVDDNAEPSSALTNTVSVSYTSMPGTNPDERTGSGIGPDDYLTSTQQVVNTAPVQIQKRLLDNRDYTIGEAITYTIAITVPTGLTRNLAFTDSIPAGLRYDPVDSFLSITTTPTFALPTYTLSQNPAGGGDGSGTSSFTVSFNDSISNTTPSVAEIDYTMRLIVADVAAANHGDSKTNSVTATWLDADNSLEIASDSAPPVTLVEPTLVISKSVTPTAAQPGDTVFYNIEVYHSPTSTIPAYNVAITDIVPNGLNYIPGSWQINMPPNTVSGSTLDTLSPQLTASFDVITPTFTAANPVRLRYAAVVNPNALFGTAFTNTITGTWTSLATNPFGDTRDGSGGVDDYRASDSAVLQLADVAIGKTGPLTVTAGSPITYALTVYNSGPFTAVDAIVTDTMPFQVDTTAATYVVPSSSSGSCTISPQASGDIVSCTLGDIQNGITATILITGTVDPETPLGADLTNNAEVTVISPDGQTFNNSASVDTEVLTLADVGVSKSGPATATAGETISYTIVLSNTGPSVSRDVDVKDLLPAGFTYVSGTSTQGTCVSGICQLGDVGVNEVVTMVVTATVGSDVTGVVTNTAAYFGDTADSNSSNDSDTASTTINALTALVIDKVDLTDPVYAGDTYLYEIVVTNTGPSDALNVVVTDTLPAQVSFEGASPECAHDGSPSDGTVTCSIGSLSAGTTRDFLINVRVASDVVSGTVGTNTTGVTTTTPIDLANSRLTDAENTTYWQKSGLPTDLQLTKAVTPTTAIAGSGRFTYTLTVTNSGPAPATAVQVVDALPPAFSFVSATSSDGSLCNSGVTCDLGEMAVGETVQITVVVDVTAATAADTYTNTAYVGSASPDSNPGNNQDSVQTTVTRSAALQVRKLSNPATATPGENLSYTILVTNTGPSDADNVTISDTLPSGFTSVLIVSSQGGCTGLPCNLGTIPAGQNASLTIHGQVSSGATTSLQNTAAVTSTTPGSGDSDTIVTPLAGSADLALVKTATATVRAGQTITYTLTVYNLGPSDAAGVLITDTLPTSVTVQSTGGCTDNLDGTITCNVGTLAAGNSQSYTLTVQADAALEPGTSLENSALVTAGTSDGNLSNNTANADTSIIGLADLSLSKSGPTTVTAGEQVTYTIVVTNSGPSVAQSVDVKD
ncbi:MAG: DUF11 domain-containing protein, partial [Caldilineae bacterium]